MTGVTHFPFSAVLGNDDLKRALLANVIDPRIGGVLIRGDRGTAKTTLVRALASLLPLVHVRASCPAACDPAAAHCPFCDSAGDATERPARIVELPLGATEDRVAGTLDLSRAVRSGERRLEPGLLAAAHRGVLYIDEVNLLPDHLVDLLLDVAASGVNVVERDGASIAHPARFVLAGTMNPEEGDLRPQLLDRFGLVVDAHTPTEPAQRAEIVRRRITFDRDPARFAHEYAEAERTLCALLARARDNLRTITVPEKMLALAVALCIEAHADGLRPDLAVYRTAVALTALDDRGRVEDHDVYAAALLALPHRQRRNPDGSPTAPPIEDIVRSHQQQDGEDTRDGGMPASPPPQPGGNNDGAGAPRNQAPADERTARSEPGDLGRPGERPPDNTTRPLGTLHVPLPPVPRRLAAGEARGRHRHAAAAPRGRTTGALPWDGRSRDFDLHATLIEDARRPDGTTRADALRMHRRAAPNRRLILLLVDASGSMGARERMASTKAALLDVIDQAAHHRDAVALEAFRDDIAQLLVAPTRDLNRVRTVVASLSTGGRTPLIDGLLRAARLLRQTHVRSGGSQQSLLVLVTDGRYPGDLNAAARILPRTLTDVLVVDTERGPIRLGLTRRLATALNAHYLALASGSAR